MGVGCRGSSARSWGDCWVCVTGIQTEGGCRDKGRKSVWTVLTCGVTFLASAGAGVFCFFVGGVGEEALVTAGAICFFVGIVGEEALAAAGVIGCFVGGVGGMEALAAAGAICFFVGIVGEWTLVSAEVGAFPDKGAA